MDCRVKPGNDGAETWGEHASVCPAYGRLQNAPHPDPLPAGGERERTEYAARQDLPFSRTPNLASLDPGYVLVRVPDALLRCARDTTTEASLERNRERTVDQRDFRNFGSAISRRAKNILIGCGKRRQITVFEKTDRSQRKPGVLPVHLGERA
jgi:hypothetical protein